MPFLKANGVDVVAIHLIGPERDDLAYLRDLEADGLVAPEATILVLNELLAPQNLSIKAAFQPVFEHPIFKAALNRGARLVWMPRLDVAHEISARRLPFTAAEAGASDGGSSAARTLESSAHHNVASRHGAQFRACRVLAGLNRGRRSMRKLNEPVASLPPPEKSGGASSLQTRLAVLIDELRQAARKTGVEVDGPLGPVLSALVLILEWLGACVAELRAITIEYGSQALQRRQADKAADEAAILRLQTQIEAARTKFIRDYGDAIIASVNELAVRRMRLVARNSGLIAAAVLTASIAASLGVGYRWGRANAEASIHETEGRLIAAFRYGVSGASNWVGLMSWNDINYALELCRRRPDLAATQHGRRACKVPLWIEPDQGAPDAVLDDILGEARQMQEQARAPEPQNQAAPEASPSLKPASAQQRPKPSR